MVKLLITEKGGEPKRLQFEKDEVSIGRVQGNDIVLAKGNVSKRHTKIVVREGQPQIVDLKSTNGTYVNGRKIVEPTVVSSADKIYVGDFLIQIESGAAESEPAPRPDARPAVPEASSEEPEPDEPVAVAASPAGAARPAGRIVPPPPPPPPRPRPKPQYEEGGTPQPSPSRPRPKLDDEDEGASAPLAGSSDDEDSLPPPPRRPVPSSRPARVVSGDQEEPSGLEPEEIDAMPPPAAPGQASSAKSEAESGLSGVSGSDALDLLLADATVSAIFISGPEEVFVERAGRVELTSVTLGDANGAVEAVRHLAADGALEPPAEAPFLDVQLGDGSRLTALMPPLVRSGACATLRKRSRQVRSLEALAASGALSSDVRQLLEACVAIRRNLLVSGDPAARAAVLGAFALAMGTGTRVVCISRGPELVPARPGWVNITAGAGPGAGVVNAAAALRPDYLVVTDVQGADAAEVLGTAAGGQEGILCGIAARSSGEAVARLEALALQGGAPSGARELALGTIDLVVHAESRGDGEVRVTELADLRLGADGRLGVELLLVWRSDPTTEGRSGGKFYATGATPRLAAALTAHGKPLPATLFRK